MRSQLTLAAAVLVVSASPCFAQSALEPARLTPDEVKWVTGPTGNPRAVLGGDERKPGVYAYRARFAPGFRNQPHFHPDDRIAMVVSGTLLVGYGEQIDESKMKALPAGSIWTEPARQPHYVWAKDGEVVIQIMGNGPSGTTILQPK